jgi:hypothetical protein
LDGVLLWQKNFTYEYSLNLNTVTIDLDGNLYLAGSIADHQSGSLKAIIVKCDGLGEILWQKTYTGSESLLIQNVLFGTDGYIYAIGSDWSGNAVFLKCSANGALIWSKKYLLGQRVCLTGLSQDCEGRLLCCGYSYSDIEPVLDSFFSVLLELSDSGELSMQRGWQNTPIQFSDFVSLGIDADGLICIVGDTSRLAGSWKSLNGTMSLLDSSQSDCDITVENINGTCSPSGFSELFPALSVDSTTGGKDVLAMKIRRSCLD